MWISRRDAYRPCPCWQWASDAFIFDPRQVVPGDGRNRCRGQREALEADTLPPGAAFSAGIPEGGKPMRSSPASHPRLRQGYPCTSAGIPHPARAFGKGYPCTSAGTPHPARACGRGCPYASAGTPTPPAPSLAGYPYSSAGLPHPARACGAPPPPPPGGGVRAWRYQVSSRARGGAGGKSYLGWSWWETVSGVEPMGSRIRLFSRISPCCGPCGYRHGGRG